MQGKIVFVKEHGEYLIEPTEQTNFLYGQQGDREFPWKIQAHSSRTEVASIPHDYSHITANPIFGFNLALSFRAQSSRKG